MQGDSRTWSVRQASIVVLFAAFTYLAGVISPPSLMDDVDAGQAQVSKTMLQTGDWVTGRLDGVIYLDKAPLKYWITAVLYAVLGVHDWVARLPTALGVILLCYVVYRIGCWAGSCITGFYGGIALATSIGLFLFTRIVIPDALITLAITLSIWAFLRMMDDEERKPLVWAAVFYAGVACSLLMKGFIGVLFPAGICGLYLLITRAPWNRATLNKLHLLPGLLIFLAIALPWHVLAILRNPPYFDLSLHAEPHFGGKFKGFFWFYFINEQILRFTNGRWPHDYNTVPRLWFWAYHVIWFFPWALYLPALRRSQFEFSTRLGRLHMLAVIWIGVVMVFFTFSTTQEYYSMPIYPALALLIGSAMAKGGPWVKTASRAAAVVTGLAFVACATLWIKTAGLATPGDISDVLSKNPDVYTLSLGHITDLTFAAFAYLRTPLLVAALALLTGTVGLWMFREYRSYIAAAVMLAVFFQAARLALIVFDPYLTSRPLAAALLRSPPGTLIFNGPYYDFSSIPFYTGDRPLLLNGRINNLEYGSYAPDAPHVFIDDAEFARIWMQSKRAYIATDLQKQKKLEGTVGRDHLFEVAESGGKAILTNSPLSGGSGSAVLLEKVRNR